MKFIIFQVQPQTFKGILSASEFFISYMLSVISNYILVKVITTEINLSFYNITITKLTHLFCFIILTYSQSVLFDLNFMRNNQDFKPNFGSYRNHHNHHKSNHSTASLISLKEHNKPLISRERQRENERNLNDKSQKKKQLKQINIDYEATNNPRVKQFRQKTTYSQAQIKKADNDQTLHVNYNTTQDPVHGILISVNIQDLITPRHLQVAQPNIVNQNLNNVGYDIKKEQTIIKTDRTEKNSSQILLRQPPDLKRVAKTTSMINVKQTDFQFECRQELSYHKRISPPPRQARQRTVSKHTGNQKNKQHSQSKQKMIVQPVKLDPHKLIEQFLSTIDQINNNSSIQSLQFLDTRQNFYRVNPKYIEDCQPNFTWLMRAYVVEWMMEVAQQFALKRQTFHISVNLLDRFLGKQKNLSKSSFQAVGAASMFIASKIEQERTKSPQDFAITTGKLITAAKLEQTQKRIYQVLQFNLYPPTLYRWANRMMVQWDSYLQSSAGMNPFFVRFEKKCFKQNTQQSYINYRVLMQLIDCCTLDIQTSQYNQKLIVCSFMYLYLLKEYKIYSAKDIAINFPGSSLYLFEEINFLNEVFNEFLFFTFGFVLQDLLPTIQYCAGYFLLPPNAEMPSFTKKNSYICDNMQLQQYQSFQTYDKNMLKVVIKRRKREPI